WLISGNAFDVMGAESAGLRGVWLQRSSSAVFDAWEGLSADATIRELSGLDEAIRTL
ncbi:MAG: haloacid dehalogenase type II, partial [Gammaproteobacteria bacterium]|nr:haloacid dehalogenase type II [Gammaproteobacteria bacterium]